MHRSSHLRRDAVADALELVATLTAVARRLRTALDQEFAPLGLQERSRTSLPAQPTRANSARP
jgi:hypothetical protein